MPKISKEMGASYGIADAPVHSTDDPNVFAVARDNAVIDERARSADLRAENVRLQRQVDEMNTASRDQRAADAERQREQGGGEQSRSVGNDAQVDYVGEQRSESTTLGTDPNQVKWTRARINERKDANR